MKYLILTLCSALVISCHSTVTFHGDNTDIKTEIVKFSKHVQKVILLDEEDHFLKHIEPEYKQMQLEQALRGNKAQFLNEFFCGLSGEIHMCMDFDEIIAIKLLEITDQKNNTYKLKYKLKSKYKEVLNAEVFLIEKDTSFYFYSAAG